MKQVNVKNENVFAIEPMNKTAANYEYIVVGLGKTGLSCANYLYDKGIHFAIVDSRDIPPGLNDVKKQMPDIDLYLGKFDKDVLTKAKNLVISPGVSQTELSIQAAKANGINIIGDIELFAQQVTKPVIAITGSNGKSTVTTLVAELLKAAGYRVKAGGNLGIPALDLLANEETDVYVLELSSFQLETVVSLNPLSSVVLNISADHMDRYKSLNEYALAKARIYQGNGRMIINHDDDYSKQNIDTGRQTIAFSVIEELEKGYSRKVVNGIAGLYKDQECIIQEKTIQIKGQHNTANVLAALALIDNFNIEQPIIKEVLGSFKGLAHRCELVTRRNDVTWYNDSKGTNVGASCASIKGLASQGQIVLIAGGDAKGAAFDELAVTCNKTTRSAILFGKDAKSIEAALSKVVACHMVRDLEAAVNKAYEIAEPGDIVLLSPACASLDMFKNYEQRGDAFVAAVNKVVGEK